MPRATSHYDLTRRTVWSGLVVVLVALGASASAAPEPAPLVIGRAAHALAAVAPAEPRRTATPAIPRAAEPPRRDAALRPASTRPEPVPHRLEIAGVDIRLPVVPVGVTADRTMQLPDTVREIGWYRFGARPRDAAGSTVLAAHVDTVDEGVGPFAKLVWLERGTVIAVTDTDGRVQRYRVATVQSVHRTAISTDQLFDRGGARRLVLITCGGDYDRETGYRDNVVVTAVPD